MPKHVCAHLVPIFSHLSEDNLTKINHIVSHTTYKKGDVLSSPYDNIGLFIIAKGHAKEYQISVAGREQLLRIIGPGDVVGEETLFSDELPTTYVEALTSVSVCLLKKEDFKKILLENPSIALELLGEFNRRLQATQKQTVSIATESVSSRIASFLLDLASDEATNTFQLPFTMKELANYLATSPETVSRRLKEMEEAGYIKRQGRQIKVIDLDDFSDYVFDLKNE
ncbi:Crp/Fnr family transcriptional regulator [Dolosicoccus paucivorans]|uniref:Crp/Fnr family transcriptional regulator n=1 Tax=Dolosicoccus paucivorans TaxID=84521 RepID=UPI000889D88C|nr:Crp/Fnr family transcriptional regulator [Dolosicoccus paucivorans]SDI72757.1 CRP/FNR family transcriptional regulator, anaerobic regulatory protein [Dolosicoccus paucivorans]